MQLGGIISMPKMQFLLASPSCPGRRGGWPGGRGLGPTVGLEPGAKGLCFGVTASSWCWSW